ncbi:MAG: GNAT family N-acetyltransferase, partial [Actinomycetota bacterium]|nr:GNAT family N-acetyltransferase [Actinomycetota bacterium]
STAEVAITVVDDWQRRGVGRLLARHLIRRALTQGLTELRATTLAENRPAIELLRALGFVPAEQDGPTVDYALDLSERPREHA